MDIGNRILEFRKQKNLSQEDLAEKIGVTRQTISKWELGETTPDIKQINKIVESFDIDLSDILSCEKKNVKKNKNIVTCLLIICSIITIIAFFKLIYNMGYNNASKSSNLHIKCYIKEKEYNVALSFWNDSKTVYQIDGSTVFNNIISKQYRNSSVIKIINIINEFATSENGFCE